METESSAAQKRFAWFAWVVLAFNIPVILWGAYVRASYSGDGCGAHWPFCNGQVVPQNMAKPMVIEFTHRMMTGVDVLLVVAMTVLAFRIYPKRHLVRRYASASLIFLFVESLLGAGLVLFRMVARDQSAGRGWYLSAHLTNTMLMLATMTLTAWIAWSGLGLFRVRNAGSALMWSAIVTIFVSVTGAVTALGDTLFPAETFLSGVRQEFAADSPMLLRLRVAHPAIAVLGTMFVIWTVLQFWRHSSSNTARHASLRVVWLCIAQLLMGTINLSLLAPVWAQIAHLFVGCVSWIALVLVIGEAAVTSPQAAASNMIGFSGRETTVGKPA